MVYGVAQVAPGLLGRASRFLCHEIDRVSNHFRLGHEDRMAGRDLGDTRLDALGHLGGISPEAFERASI